MKFQNSRAIVTVGPPALTIWRTIQIGTGIENGESFCSKLKRNDYQFTSLVREMLQRETFRVAPKVTEVDLVVLSVADLGGGCYDAICGRAIEMGLELCPDEVGPQLRLQYPDQPRDEWLAIAMEAIPDSRGHLFLFTVKHDRFARCLCSYPYAPDLHFGDDRKFVFRLPRKSTCPAGRQPSVA